MSDESFAVMLTGGHPNSLGRTLEVVECIRTHPDKLAELYACYFSPNAVVRLRTSNAIKRLSLEHPDWLIPYIDRFLSEISLIQQPSAQWTLATLFQRLAQLEFMSESQKNQAKQILQHNLESYSDWIVLTTTLETLSEWAATDQALKMYLLPHLERLASDPRKAVAGRAQKIKARLKYTL